MDAATEKHFLSELIIIALSNKCNKWCSSNHLNIPWTHPIISSDICPLNLHLMEINKVE